MFKYTLPKGIGIIAVLASLVVATVVMVSANHGLVSHWEAEGNALDSTGSNHGTLVGNTTFAPGVTGQAFSFDGAGDYVMVPHDPSLDLTSAITLAAWIQTSATNNFSGIVGKIEANDPGRRGYLLTVNAGSQFRCDMVFFRDFPSDLDQGTAESTTIVEDGNWHHVACTYDGASVKVYVDGIFENEVPFTSGIGSNTEPLLIGRDPHNAPNRDFNGLIDDVRIYDTALDAAAIAALHRGGPGGDGDSEDSDDSSDDSEDSDDRSDDSEDSDDSSD